MKTSSPARIYLLALLARLLPVILAFNMGIGLDDMFQYDMLARSLANGHGYRWYAEADLQLLERFVDFDLSSTPAYDPRYGTYTSFRAPLYPGFLALIYALSGTGSSRFFVVRMVQAVLLGASLVPLTYSISRELFPDSERSSHHSSAIIAFYPMLLVYPLGLVTENLFIPLLLLSFLVLLRTCRIPGTINFILSGALLGLASLTRSVILPFALLAITYLGYRFGKSALPALAVFILLISPWVIRNSLLHNRVTGIETSLGFNLYLGYHPDGSGSFLFGPSLDLIKIMDDSVRDQIGMQRAFEFIKDSPERFLPLAVQRLGYFFALEKRALMYFYSNNLLGYMPKPLLLLLAGVVLLPFMLISLLSAFVLPTLDRHQHGSILLAILFLAYLLPHVLILSEDRFHLALVPFFAILAAQAWRVVAGWVHWYPPRNPWFAFSVLLCILLLLNWGAEIHRDFSRIELLLGPAGNMTYLPY